MELNDEQWEALCALAGIEAASATGDEVITSLTAALDPGESPETATVDAETLTELQALASDGMLWREHRRTDEARQLVEAACNDGKIGASSRERWFNYLLSDPEDAKPRLERIKAGTIPRVELGRDQSEHDYYRDDDNADRPRWVR